MPIYEFSCTSCGNVQEVIVSNSRSCQEVEMKCNACEGENLERILSRVSYSVKAGGGSGKSEAGPSISTKTCGENTCGTIDIPGPSR